MTLLYRVTLVDPTGVLGDVTLAIAAESPHAAARIGWEKRPSLLCSVVVESGKPGDAPLVEFHPVSEPGEKPLPEPDRSWRERGRRFSGRRRR